MGIIQEDRVGFVPPTEENTEYGAKTVVAATETPIVEPEMAMEQVQEPTNGASVAAEPQKAEEKPAETPKKRGGRPKKSAK